MPADPSSSFSSSMLFKATIFTISFTSIYFYKQGIPFLVTQKPIAKKDTLAKVDNTKPAAKKKKKTIYLTFDDGPCKGSKTVLNILKNTQVQATFFVIGEHVLGSTTQAAIYDSLKACATVEIANHSYTHAHHNNFSSYYTLPDSVVNDFKRNAVSLHFESNITRTPGRNIWRTATINHTDIKTSANAADSLYKNGYSIVGWDVEWHFDHNQNLLQNEVQMYNQIDSVLTHNKTKTPNHVVLLTHDRIFARADDSVALLKLITHLIQKEEYNFEVISQYPQLKRDTL